MKPKIYIAEDGSGLLLLPTMRPGPSLILEAGDAAHFIAQPEGAIVTALPTAMTQTLACWLDRWTLKALKVQRDPAWPNETVAEITFSNGMTVAYADPPSALYDPSKIGKFEAVFTVDRATHATIRRKGEPNGALTIAVGIRDSCLSANRFAGFPDPKSVAREVATTWERKWGYILPYSLPFSS